MIYFSSKIQFQTFFYDTWPVPDGFFHPSILEMNAPCRVLAGSPSSLIFLSPSHDWSAKDPICSGGETVPSPGTAGSSLPVHGSFCCWGATFEIFCSQWCRECTGGRTPSQLSSHTPALTSGFTHRQYFFFCKHPTALDYPALGWELGRGCSGEAGVAFWLFSVFNFLWLSWGKHSAALLALQRRWKSSVRSLAASPRAHAGTPG